MTKEIEIRAKKIELLLMDVDGVLTPGHMVIMDSGKEIKIFNVQDGFGIMLWHKAGLKSAIITAGKAPAISHRARALNVDAVYDNIKDKLGSYNQLKDKFNLSDDQICFIGDDLIDIPILKRAGLACVVENANIDTKRFAHYKCGFQGGRGAVREIIDMILKSKGLWHKVTRDYYR
jgi:3-deoxy-D-manno-octulosonate 8-phosphate phosphatase (KDO 8-P phosphatase)